MIRSTLAYTKVNSKKTIAMKKDNFWDFFETLETLIKISSPTNPCHFSLYPCSYLIRKLEKFPGSSCVLKMFSNLFSFQSTQHLVGHDVLILAAPCHFPSVPNIRDIELRIRSSQDIHPDSIFHLVPCMSRSFRTMEQFHTASHGLCDAVDTAHRFQT